MLGFLKSNPLKKLQKQYETLLVKGVEAQRNGNIELFSKISKEADQVLKEIERIEEKNKME